MNILVLLRFLFCFHLGWVCDLCFSQNCWKSFYSCNKNKQFRYQIIQATSISVFIPLWGIKVGIERKYILHSWVADQSTGFLLARGSHLNVKIAKLGKSLNKNENFNHRTTINAISWLRIKTKPRQPHY